MVADLIVRSKDLVENPTARIPVCLVLDTSVSMGPRWVYPDWVVQEGTYSDEGWVSIPEQYASYGQPDSSWTPPIDELNAGISEFLNAVRADPVAKWAAELAVVTFGGAARLVSDFCSVDNYTAPPLDVEGNTPMGQAVRLALDTLENRKREYSQAGVDYFQPWLVLMTDGRPSDDIHAAASRAAKLVSSRKLSVFPIGIGQDADMGALAAFSPGRAPLRLKGLRFREFFAWLSKSISRTSQSIPGEKIDLDVDGLHGWAEL